MINLLDTINWREPLWLLLSLQPLLVHLLLRLVRSIRNDHYAEPQLLAWAKLDNRKTNSKGLIYKVLLVLAWLGFSIAMAGPRTADKVFSTEQSSYNNIMILLDVSRSMSANDIRPSRLERAKLELYDFIDRSKHARIGITLYAAKTHLLSPLTSDKNLLHHYISTIDTSILPTRGSDLKNALEYTTRYLNNKNKNSQAVLLVSDGESTLNNIEHYENILTKMKENNISVFSLITGTESGAPLLSGQSGWLTFEDQGVVSKTQANLLENIALRTNGKYSSIDTTDNDWQILYDDGIARLNPVEVNSQKNSDLIIWNEWYPWFLLFAIACFIVAHINMNYIKNLSYSSIAIWVGVLASVIISTKTFANETYQQAYQAYQQRNYLHAEQQFSRLQSFSARIGQASAAYQTKDYTKAVMLFIQASLDAQTDKQRVHALFNLANSYYQLGDYKIAASIYEDVLRYQPDFKQATVNLGFAKSLSKQQKEGKKISTTRGGKGPRISTPVPGMDLGKANLTLGDQSDTKPYNLSKSTDSLLTQQQADLSSAGLVTQDVESAEDTTWTYQVRSIEELVAMKNSISSNERIFWQRLFEWEEGFPAPLKEPLDVPGVKPW